MITDTKWVKTPWIEPEQKNVSMSTELCLEIYNQSPCDISNRAQVLKSILNDLGFLKSSKGIGIHHPINRETVYDCDGFDQFITENELRLGDDQKVYQSILESIENVFEAKLFSDSSGATDKTFLIKQLLSFRQKNNIILAVESFGIVATLLDGWKTAQFMVFKPKILFDRENIVWFKKLSKAKFLQICKLIIWDEATFATIELSKH